MIQIEGKVFGLSDLPEMNILTVVKQAWSFRSGRWALKWGTKESVVVLNVYFLFVAMEKCD